MITTQPLRYRLREDGEFVALEINLHSDEDNASDDYKWKWVYAYRGYPTKDQLVLCCMPIAIALRHYSGIVFDPVEYREHDGKWIPCQEEE